MADPMTMLDQNAMAARMRDVIERLAVQSLQRHRPRIQYATVVAFDRTARTCDVQLAGDSGIYTVGMGAVQPSTTGQVVRIDGPPGDRYIADVLGTAHVLGATGEVTAHQHGYTHTQSMASAVWTITHNLNRHPAVTVVDSAGSKVYGDVDYLGPNSLTVTFVAPFSGSAYLS